MPQYAKITVEAPSSALPGSTVSAVASITNTDVKGHTFYVEIFAPKADLDHKIVDDSFLWLSSGASKNYSLSFTMPNDYGEIYVYVSHYADIVGWEYDNMLLHSIAAIQLWVLAKTVSTLSVVAPAVWKLAVTVSDLKVVSPVVWILAATITDLKVVVLVSWTLAVTVTELTVTAAIVWRLVQTVSGLVVRTPVVPPEVPPPEKAEFPWILVVAISGVAAAMAAAAAEKEKKRA